MNASLLIAREPERTKGSPMSFRPADRTPDLGNGYSFSRLLLSHRVPPGPLPKSLSLELPARASLGCAVHRVSLEQH